MTDFSIKVSEPISNDHVFDNCAYYKSFPNNLRDNNCYVLFKEKNIIKLVKKISSHDVKNSLDHSIKDNTIYLTQQDRLNLRASVGQVVDVKLVNKPETASKIIVTMLDKKKLNKIPIIKKIENTFKRNITNTVLNANSFYTFIAAGIYNAHIQSIINNSNKEIKHGFVDETTEIFLNNQYLESNIDEAITIIVAIEDAQTKKTLEKIPNDFVDIIKKTIVNTIVASDKKYFFHDSHCKYNAHIISIFGQANKKINTGMVCNNAEIIIVDDNNTNINYSAINLSSVDYENIGVGGLQKEFTELIKSIFITRIIPDNIFKKMGIKHTKGAILYGPPGCGKTRIARQLGKIIGCNNIKIINGPELLDKYHGESERKIRECFDDAKKNPKELHLLIFDEFDTIAGKRSNSDNNRNRDSIVGQLLTMLDGVEEMNNIIVFALTNRLDIIDPAIIRPGRFGIHIKIDLPDLNGRYEILKIHLKTPIDNNMLESDVDLLKIASQTENFTGAEIESLVQTTIQYVLGAQIDFNNIVETAKKIDKITISEKDFLECIPKINPMFKNKSRTTCELGKKIKKELSESDCNKVTLVLNYIQNSLFPVVCCLEGPSKCGKTTLTCQIGISLGIENIEYISATILSTKNNQEKIHYLIDIFSSAIPSLIIIDNIEMIIEYVSDNFFNSSILQAIKVLLNETHHHVIITTSYYNKLSKMTILDSVDLVVPIIEKK